MRKFLKWTVYRVGGLAAIGIVAIWVAAAPGQANDSAKLRHLLRLVGVDTTLASIPSGISHGVKKGPATIKDGALGSAIDHLAKMHFDPSDMMERVVAHMAHAFSDAKLNQLIDYYSKGVGKQATDLEIAAQQPGQERVMETEGRLILRGLVEAADERLSIYRRLLEALGGVESGTAVAISFTYALMSGMMGSDQLPYYLNDQQILEIVKGQRKQFEAAVTDQAFVSMAYTYREMSLENLESYVVFIESDAGQALHGNLVPAITDLLLSRAQAFGHDVMVLTGARDA